jgi:hypothetical protein
MDYRVLVSYPAFESAIVICEKIYL